MKSYRNIFITALAAAVLFGFAGKASAEDKYETLAKEIADAGSSVSNKKIAIIPFSYADGRAAAKDGAVISERLTMKLIKLQKFEIVERSMLDKVMGELKLQNSGVMDATSTQQLGKLLGVEAIVTGTLVEMQAGKIEVNARLIKTETAQAIGAAQMTVEKDWVGDAATPQVQPQQPAQDSSYYQQPVQQAQQQAYYPPAPKVRSKYQYGFFEIFYGFGSPEMNMEFSNSNGNIHLNGAGNNELGINCPSCGNRGFRTVTFEKLKTDGYGPFAMRFGGFSNTFIGGDVEFSYEKRNILAQDTTWSLNSAAPANFTFGTNDYATVKTFGISFDLLLRVPGEVVDPYTGIGLGLAMNNVTLPYVWGVNSAAPAEEFAPGLMVRFPLGVRFRLPNHMSLVTEARYEVNNMTFDRGFVGESDSIILKGWKFIVGMGITF